MIDETALQLLRSQRTIRSYSAEPPDGELLRECVRIAQRAPSTSNHQPYCVISIEEPSVRCAVLDCMLCQPYVHGAPALMLVCVDWSRQDALAQQVGLPNGINRASKLVVGIADASIFAHCLVLAMQACGLGVSYVASPYTALARLAELLSIPPGQAMPLHLIAAGYPAESPDPRPRYPLNAVMHQDAFRQAEPDTVQDYFREGSRQLERDDYFRVTGDSIHSWREHYQIKFGPVAQERTWNPLARDLAQFFTA